MRLTAEEQEMLSGERGNAVQKAMELLVALGECYDAERMVPVTSAHLVACNPIAAGKGGTRYIKDLAKCGAIFVVPTTTNPACLELWDWKEMGFSQEIKQEQEALSEVIAQMGGFVCNTCTPYLIGHTPLFREHVAWGESSAIIYANAVLGARTNREGGPTGLASAITGRTPAYGYHLDENRYGTIKIVVNVELHGDTDYGTLGYFTGKIVRDKVPIFTGIPLSVSHSNLKALGAALATSGSAAHYHVVSVTPEAPSEEVASGSRRIGSSDTIEFGPRELKKSEESLSAAEPEAADVVILGCPHASIDQVKHYANLLSGRKVRSNVEIWILISHALKQYAEDIGLAKIIECAGARLVSNTCPSPMPREFFRERGYRVMAVDSPKMIYYLSTTKNVTCHYGSLSKFIDIVTKKGQPTVI